MSFDFGLKTEVGTRLGGIFNVVAIDALKRATILEIVNEDGTISVNQKLSGQDGLLQIAMNITHSAKASVDSTYGDTAHIHLEYKRSICSAQGNRDPNELTNH